jgi:hypothetical protein
MKVHSTLGKVEDVRFHASSQKIIALGQLVTDRTMVLGQRDSETLLPAPVVA